MCTHARRKKAFVNCNTRRCVNFGFEKKIQYLPEIDNRRTVVKTVQ